MRALVIVWLARLLCLIPLAALLVASLGLLVLKRQSSPSPVKARLSAPPVYLVSLPIATLVTGMEMLGLYFLLILHNLLSPFVFPWGDILAECLSNPLPSYILLLFTTELPFDFDYVLFASFIGFFAAIAMSGYLLWRTVRHEDHPKLSSRIGSQRLLGLLILISFAWAYMFLVAYVPVWGWLFI